MKEKRNIICAVLLIIFLGFCSLATASADSPTEDLVALYEEGGKTPDEQFLLEYYHLLFSPERLSPMKYDEHATCKKIQPLLSATTLILEIKHSWNELSPETQAELGWVFLRPTEPGGGWDKRQHLLPQLYTSPSGKFVIHWTNGTDGGLPEDAPSLVDTDNDGTPDYIEELAEAFDYVWEVEINIYGYHEPPSDATKPNDAHNTNPNDKYDVFVYDLNGYAAGYADPEQYNIITHRHGESYSYIAIDNNHDSNWKETVSAHEFFHAIQFYYDCGEERWWMETTAVWMQDEVYDHDFYLHYLHHGPPPVMDPNGGWLDNPDVSLTTFNGWHEYGNGIFGKFLSEKKGTTIIKDIWEEMASTDGLIAIDNVLKTDYGTDLKTVFSDFTVTNYLNGNNNHDGNFANDQYEEGDLYDDVALTADRTYSGTTINIPDTVNEWAADYIQFTSTVEDGVEVEFQGEEIFLLGSSNYVVKIILYNATYPEGKVIDFVENHKGKEILPKANEYDKIVLVIACTGHPWTGDGDYSVILKKVGYLDVVLDFDCSGSMSGQKIIDAKNAAKTFVDLLEKPSGWIFKTDRDKVGLVSFSSSATLDRHLTSDFNDAKNVINGYSAGGSTNMGDALSKSISELKTNGRDDTIWSIIYFTDGMTNTGLTREEILNTLVPQAVDAGISIYTCGYGGDVDSTFLSQVASAANGKYYFAPDSATLKQIYIELSHTAKGWQPTASFSGKVAQGETKTVGILNVQPGTSLIKVILSWPGSDLDLILIDPTGNQTMPGAGVIYSGNDTLPEYYEIYDPQPGNWTIEVYGKEITSPEEEYYVMVFQPGALMQVKPTKWDVNYPLNRTMIFNVSEIAGNVNLTNVTFSASDLTETVAASTVKSLMKSQAEAEERGEAITPSLTKAYAQNMNVIPANCFSFTPNNFSVPAGSSVDVQATLTLPSASIPSGTYSGNIYVNSSGGNATISVTAIVTSVNTSTGTGTAYFASDAGSIEDLISLDESDLPEENPNVDFPHGLFGFNITGLNPNQTVNITIVFPQDIPTTAEYWKYNASSGEWYQIPMGSNDGDNIITITLQDGGMGDDDGVENGVISDPGAPGVLSAQPSAASTSATGAPREIYRVDEDVYAAGSGFASGTEVEIYVVHDRDWNDGDPIPGDVTGSVETVSVNNSDVGPVLVWHAPLTTGRYDIVIDANRNGVYDAATDGLDGGSPGFVVVPETPPAPVPALTPVGVIVLIGLLGFLSLISVSRIKKRV